MNLTIRHELFEQTKMWIREAGILIKEKLNEPLLVNTQSSKNDLLTEIDKSIEVFFVKKITETYPNDVILSEESLNDTLIDNKGVTWIIDPIDGTMNLVHQQSDFAISVGIYDSGVGEIGFIYDVMNDQLYSAVRGKGAFKNNVQMKKLDEHLTLDKSLLCVNPRWLCKQKFFDKNGLRKMISSVHGIRYYGAATLQIAYVAEGKLGAYLSMSLEPWDYAAGKIILQEVGGVISKVDGTPINSLVKESCIVCHPQIHQELVKLLNSHI